MGGRRFEVLEWFLPLVVGSGIKVITFALLQYYCNIPSPCLL